MAVKTSEVTIFNATPPPPVGDDGGMPPPPSQTCSKDPARVPCPPEETEEDPCAKMKREKQNFGNTFNAQLNSEIQSKPGSFEYGTNLRLTSPTSNSFKNTPITTTNSADSWTPTFTWNSTDGYTIGSAHRHPGGSAPSPDDVFSLVDNLINPNLRSAGTNDINVYKKNAYITVTTSTSTFVVTVNNWGFLASLYNTFNTNRNAFDSNYQNIASEYQDRTHADDATATAYALSNLFGNSISIYKAPAGTTSFAIASIDANGKLTIIPCP